MARKCPDPSAKEALRERAAVAELARVQDQVTQRIASALNVALVDAESRRA
jgi:hypothetical protein